ncbi:MAG TPA: protein kinase [Candidatus Paceibacterota bacterium]|nr:protein kinase [Candidatus Paceibacterota bacterium]HRZ91416.1 protein kinase [Candidatus Paceibacterota bacterium]
MNAPSQHEKEIFNDALELTPAEARHAYVREACAGDEELRQRVEALLEAAGTATGFLPHRPDVPATEVLAEPVAEGPRTAIGRYTLLESIGEGGFGVVYMAEQREPVRRRVALKIIKAGMDTQQVIGRFEAERQALALMEHPNIARVFDAGATETGRPYFVMELVRGKPITQFCDEACLSTGERLQLFVQVCHAVQHAHQKGIIHRDLKPSNILVTVHDGVPAPKIIDFGIAKATAQPLTDKTVFTSFSQFLGTPAYMSPEQAALTSVDIDTRSDIYALGVLLYELLTGQTPFDAKSLLAAGLDTLCRAIREQEPVRPSTRLRIIPQTELTATAQRRQSDPPKLIHLLRGDLDWIVLKSLEKDRNRRYETAHALAMDVQRHLRHEPILARSPSVLYVLQKFGRRHRARLGVASAVSLLAAGLIGTGWGYRRASHLQWAKGEALPRVLQLVREGQNQAAFDLARKAQLYIPNDTALRDLWPRMCAEYSVTTTPAGAEVWCREYTATNQAWRRLGRTPLEKATLARCMYRWRFEKEGFAPHQCVGDQESLENIRLREADEPEGMVWIGGGTNWIPAADYSGMEPVGVPAFLIDQHEVTNERFKRFVEQGGYQDPRRWAGLRFVRDGLELSWAEAMLEFRDKTGQPGPATWEGGTYRQGQGNYPVGGLSWYEAAAYARFAGKRLPSVHEWDLAACLGESQVIVPLSNLGPERKGLAPAGHYIGMGHTGLYDMAGNVREWCCNATDDAEKARYTLGGSWDEPTYVFTAHDSRSPWNRSPENGFRCALFPAGETAPPAGLFAPLPPPAWRDISGLSPLSDVEFEALRSLYRYDARPLKAKVESAHDTSLFWREEKIRFDAAYGGERVIAHLFLPKTGKAPYQTVIFFPGVNAVSEESFTGLPYGAFTEYVIQSGRALLFPIYYGTYERPAARGRIWSFASVVETPWAYRDWMVFTTKDLGRCIDFLETRRDIDSQRIAYYGVSHGAILGPVMLAVEQRIKTGVFAMGGLVPINMPRYFDIALYAQRVRTPVLMVNGSEDALVPLMASQQPLYELLRQANAQTTRRLYPGGHGALEGLFGQQIRDDVLAWLDRRLGAVP